jgi:hypothetical protein
MKDGVNRRFSCRPESRLSQYWGFIAFEIRIVYHENKTLQSLGIAKHIAWNPLTFQAEEIEKSMERANDVFVKQSI